MFFVRTAAETDLERVREILLVTYHATYDQLVGSETVDMICAEHFSSAALSALRDLPSSEFLVADNGEVVGGMAYATQSGKVITLHQLHVHPLYHGGKTGLHLMIEIENSFLDAETVRVEVPANSEQAIGFFKKYGFAQISSDSSGTHHLPGVAMIAMEKPVLYAED
ncbi:MAG: GNAT family N-acetyltransferase [Rhizobiaceae bacterium]|nr:GNAT family N-acetyltransferase [Rhizobiaceae bacterium]